MDDPLSMTRLEWLALSWVEWLLCARPFPILFIEFLSTSKKDVINLSFLMKKGGFQTITWLPKVKQRQYQTSKHIFNHYAMQTSCMKYATIKAKTSVEKRNPHVKRIHFCETAIQILKPVLSFLSCPPNLPFSSLTLYSSFLYAKLPAASLFPRSQNYTLTCLSTNPP